MYVELGQIGLFAYPRLRDLLVRRLDACDRILLTDLADSADDLGPGDGGDIVLPEDASETAIATRACAHVRHIQQMLVEPLHVQQLGQAKREGDQLPSEEAAQKPCEKDVRKRPSAT